MKKPKLLLFIIMLSVIVLIPQVKGNFEKGLGFVAPTIIDKNNVYNPESGEIIYDQSTGDFYGRKHDSTWVSLSTTTSTSVPVGTILSYVGITPPSGFLLCDGNAISRTTYSDLYTVIGNAFGEGDGSTTFNLPNFKGKFLRGWDNGDGTDPDSASRTACATGGNTGDNIGSCQGNQLKSHSHVIDTHNTGSGVAAYAGYGNSTDVSPNATTNSTGGNETRPVNVTVNYIIKI